MSGKFDSLICEVILGVMSHKGAVSVRRDQFPVFSNLKKPWYEEQYVRRILAYIPLMNSLPQSIGNR